MGAYEARFNKLSKKKSLVLDGWNVTNSI